LNQEEIEITIDENGEVVVEMHNFKGKGCANIAEDLIKQLGSSKKSSKKPEYYSSQTCAKNEIKRK